MSVFIENEYDKEIEIDYVGIIEKVIEAALDFAACPFECEINVTIVDNDRIREINKEYRDVDRATDVLSFPLLEYQRPGNFSFVEEKENIEYFNPDTGELMLGDIVLSYDKVISQAEEYNHSRVREIAFLITHSMLHLFGYDHMEFDERMEMEWHQNAILRRLGITRDF